MRELERKQKIRKFIYSAPLLFLLLIPTFFLSRGAFGILKKEMDNSKRVEELKLLTRDLNDRQDMLRESIENLKTSEGIDAEIRNRFNVAKTNEMMAIIVENEMVGTSTAISSFDKLKNKFQALKSLWFKN